MAKQTKDHALQTRIPTDLDEALTLIARANRMSKSDVVRKALEAEVKKKENARAALLEKLRERHREEERALGLTDEEP